jgi:hypothetical protein
VASRRLAGRWQAQASYVLAKADGTVDNSYDDGVGPFGGSQNYTSANWGLVNTKGPLTFDFRHELKLLGSYRVPGVELGLNAYFLLVSGYTYTPLAQIAVGPDATDQVPLEPRGNRRLPHQAMLNVRVERAVEVGRGRVGFYVDVTNLFNANTATSPQDRFPSTAIEGYDQPILLGAPLKILPPRQTTLGARWTF